jgi:uncharacterized membrane protein YfcA
MLVSTEQLFTDARTQNGYLDVPLPDGTLRELYELMKWGPTAANSTPARLCFVRTPEARARLIECMNPGNRQKVSEAPVTVIVGMDLAFHEYLPKLFPHTDARAWFAGKDEAIRSTAFRNSSLQGGYLIIAARALGLDCGPMSGFDAAKVDAAFWAGSARAIQPRCWRVTRAWISTRPAGLSESLPLITDPAFWAAAVPAALMIGISKSGFAGGIGTLAVPLMALSIGVPQAAAITLPLLMAADVMGLRQLWRERDGALLRILLVPGLLGIALGWLLFGLMSVKMVSGVVGALTLLFLAQSLLFPPRAEGTVAPPLVGRVLAAVSGFTSFIAHAGGPPISAYLLPMRLDPLRMAGTAAVFFAVINASKVLPYATLGLVDLRNLLTSLVLLPLAPLGVWIGVWALKRVDRTWFYRLAYGFMGLTGAKLLWDGLK